MKTIIVPGYNRDKIDIIPYILPTAEHSETVSPSPSETTQSLEDKRGDQLKINRGEELTDGSTVQQQQQRQQQLTDKTVAYSTHEQQREDRLTHTGASGTTSTSNMLVTMSTSSPPQPLTSQVNDSGEAYDEDSHHRQVYIPEDISIPANFILKLSQTYDG